RHLSVENLAQRAVIFPVRPAPLYVPSSPLGLPGIGFQGAGHYSADNPPYGAVFSYFLKDPILSRKERRQKAEAAKEKQGADIGYPSWDSLKAEEREEDPALIVTVLDSAGNVVRRFTGSTGRASTGWRGTCGCRPAIQWTDRHSRLIRTIRLARAPGDRTCRPGPIRCPSPSGMTASLRRWGR